MSCKTSNSGWSFSIPSFSLIALGLGSSSHHLPLVKQPCRAFLELWRVGTSPRVREVHITEETSPKLSLDMPWRSWESEAAVWSIKDELIWWRQPHQSHSSGCQKSSHGLSAASSRRWAADCKSGSCVSKGSGWVFLTLQLNYKLLLISTCLQPSLTQTGGPCFRFFHLSVVGHPGDSDVLHHFRAFLCLGSQFFRGLSRTRW